MRACTLALLCRDLLTEVSKVLDPDATLTQEEILSRFKRVFNREMTPAEKRSFFLLESSAYPDTDSQPKAAKHY